MFQLLWTTLDCIFFSDSEWTGLEFQQFECFLLSWVPLFFKVWPQTDGYDYQLQVDYISAWSLAVEAFRTLSVTALGGFPPLRIGRVSAQVKCWIARPVATRKCPWSSKLRTGWVRWGMAGCYEIHRWSTQLWHRSHVVNSEHCHHQPPPSSPQQQDGQSLITQFKTNLNHNHKHPQYPTMAYCIHTI